MGLDVLPKLSITGNDQHERQQATGTAGQFAPGFAPTTDNLCISVASADNSAVKGGDEKEGRAFDVSVEPVKENNPQTTLVNGLHQERETRFELATSSLGS